jgi:hypothetical protein
MINPKILGLRIAGSIFAIVALLHLLRIITAASVMISGWELPVWINWMGFAGASFLSAWLWVLSVNRER